MWFCWSLGNPRAVSLQIVGAAVEGTVLSAEKEYWGGEEGASVFRWFRVLTFVPNFQKKLYLGTQKEHILPYIADESAWR